MFKLPNANYKFTDKKLSPLSVMSMVLSIISFIALAVMLIMSFKLAGEVSMRTGVTTFLCLIFSLTALGLSIRTYFQKNVYHIFSHIGTAVSAVNLFYIMYVYGVGFMGA
ncbi:MAG: hypothetical protein J5515_06260 [Lachnospiraceae bacterium]|jgi:ABC-type transport system involved in cytochrome c biogenesis permease subunit|nr:hypothetical protein [Lachnospiraceae bacterium]MBO4776199.1 hypothetical protein [Lachnospiraceae bacterium]